jgi:DeoR family ulaG and ulaABCDEF operon transcriptional repressor
MVENAGIRLIVAQVSANAGKGGEQGDSAEVA